MATQKTQEALRGKERIQQLMEMFPEATLRKVISTDMTREGIRANETSRQLGRWALPDAPDVFDRNKEDVFHSAERTEGYYLVPLSGYFGDGATFAYAFDSRSPYEVRYEERGRYGLYRDGDPLEEVFFTPRPQWYDKKTSSGRPMPLVIKSSENVNFSSALTYCEYGKDTCRYCNINTSQEVHKGLGMERLTSKRDQDIYETWLTACQERTQRKITLSGGVILNTSKEADNYVRIVRALRRAEKDAGYQTPTSIRVVCQALESENTMKLKEAGVSFVQFNLEMWDPRLFEIMCPGKAKYVGRERWLERLLGAVEIFGRGNVATHLIQGLEMMEPYGFKTEDEGAASYLEGCEWMLEHGVLLQPYPLRCAPGEEFAGRYPGRTEYLLRLDLAISKLEGKYKLGPMAYFADIRREGPGDRPHGK